MRKDGDTESQERNCGEKQGDPLRSVSHIVAPSDLRDLHPHAGLILDDWARLVPYGINGIDPRPATVGWLTNATRRASRPRGLPD